MQIPQSVRDLLAAGPNARFITFESSASVRGILIRDK